MMTLRPILFPDRPPPDRHAGDSDDLSERGMLADRWRRIFCDAAQLRKQRDAGER